MAVDVGLTLTNLEA